MSPLLLEGHIAAKKKEYHAQHWRNKGKSVEGKDNWSAQLKGTFPSGSFTSVIPASEVNL